MTFLPIVERELRITSRKLSTYLIRAGAAFAGLLLCLWMFLMMRYRSNADISMTIFVVLTAATGLYSLFSGARWTADCLSQEKRDGTFGLLFLTDLKGYDVVLGKLVASSVSAFYGLMAVLPVFSLPLLLGGVTLGEIARTSLVALNTMFFSLSVGICVSACSRSGRRSIGMTFLILLVLAGVLPSLGAWGAAYHKISPLHPMFFWASPGFTYYWAFDMNFRAGTGLFWKSIAVTHALAWVALGLAAFVVPRTWQDRPAGVARQTWRDGWRNWLYGPPSDRAARRGALLEINPFLWICSRSRFKPYSVWIVLGLLAAGWFYGYYKLRGDWLNEGVYFVSGLVLNLLLKGWVAAECGRQIAEERQQGSLELLLCTPLSVPDILRGQFLALRRQFLGPFLITVILWVVFLNATIKNETNSGQRDFWTALWVSGLIMLVADLYAIYWVGMWQGLTAKNPNRVGGQTVIRILVVPWLALMGLLLLITLSDHFSWQGFITLWVVCGFIADFGFAAFAYNKLTTGFRETAAQKYSPKQGFWRTLTSAVAPASPLAEPRSGPAQKL
jgi:ABC-type transport system involved in cytochrome c biogenesis permease component